MEKLSQIDYVVQKCKAAIHANIPIIYLVTDDISLIDKLLKTQEIVPFWYFNTENEWTRHMDPDIPTGPDNIFVCDGEIKCDFGSWGEGVTIDKIDNTFSLKDPKWRYIKLNNVRGGIPQVIAVRNYHRSDIYSKASDDILQRLVTYRQNFNRTDGVQRCTIILQSPVFDIPKGLEPYVEVIEVQPLRDDEIESMIVDFATTLNEKPYKECLDMLTAGMRGLSANKIHELLHRIALICGGIFNTKTEHEGLEIVSDVKQQMLKKEGLLKAIDLGDKEAAGLELVKNWVVERRPVLADPIDAKRRWTLDAPKGILVNGIPGTGKSLLAKEIATQLGLPLYQFDMGQVLGKHMGESEKNMQRVFSLVKALSPCILWVDEIEKAFSSASSSGDGDSGVGKRVFGSFLTWMQEKSYPCLIFATANDISKLPPELLRRGRFDMKFFTFMPTKSECHIIMRNVIGGKGDKYVNKFAPGIISDSFIDDILRYCGSKGKFLTGADIDGIIGDAKFNYFRKYRALGANGDHIFQADKFRECLIEAIDNVRTYGETDMDKIVQTLFTLARNMFSPASKTNIVNLSKVDYYNHTLPPYTESPNGYDELLYQAIEQENERIIEQENERMFPKTQKTSKP